MRGSARWHWERKFPFLKYIWKSTFCPLQGQKACWAPLSSHSTARDRGTQRGQITWLQLFIVLHHRLRHQCRCTTAFLGQNVRCSVARFSSREGRDPRLAGSLKIWSSESQPVARDKTRTTVVLGMLRAGHRQVESRDLTKA